MPWFQEITVFLAFQHELTVGCLNLNLTLNELYVGFCSFLVPLNTPSSYWFAIKFLLSNDNFFTHVLSFCKINFFQNPIFRLLKNLFGFNSLMKLVGAKIV